VNGRRLPGSRRGWVQLTAVAAALSLVLAGVALAAFPGGGGGGPAVLAPGSSGSLHHYAWWDPRGWFGGGGSAPRARPIAGDGRAQAGHRVGRVVVPPPRRVAEVVGKRSANTRVYRLSNGKLQAVISAVPVNYRDKAGRWRPVDTGVRPAAGPGFRYQNLSNTFRSFFGAGAGRMVRFEVPGGGWLEMGLNGAHLSSPRVSGNMVDYPRAMSGTGLSYQVTPTALREGITLASPSAPGSFSYTIKVGGGLVPWQRRGGQIVFSRESAGTPPVLMLPAPYMTSARNDRWSPYGKVWSAHVVQRFAWDAAARLLRLTLTPDAVWLHQPGRVFPVVIDPTIAVVPDSSSAQNVMIDQDTPSTNYAGDYRLEAGTTGTGSVRSLLSFPLSSIPAGAYVNSADLRLYRDQNFGMGSSSETVQVDQASSAWNATTATWSNASNNDGMGGKNEVIVDDSGFLAIVVPGLVRKIRLRTTASISGPPLAGLRTNGTARIARCG
jgi:hypothetical protein